MFQNGLLVTFIPEILMVIGYVLCLFTPGITSQNPSAEPLQMVAHVSSYEQQQISTYQLSYTDFQIPADVNTDIKQILPFSVQKDTYLSFESPFSTSDGLSFVDFSRPPPAFVS